MVLRTDFDSGKDLQIRVSNLVVEKLWLGPNPYHVSL